MMSLAEAPPAVASPPQLAAVPLYRLSVEQYEAMERIGVFDPDDKVELLQGVVFHKMPTNPPHMSCLTKLAYLMMKFGTAGWVLRNQGAIRLADQSMPEPDLAFVRGELSDFDAAHPTARQTALVIEVSDSSLTLDLGTKAALYAEAHIPEYWVVDLVNRRVHVHTLPRRGKNPGYKSVVVIAAAGEIPLTLRGESFGTVAVKEFLP